ncbi:MFS transporter [Fimbriimonas ginsengisoli]|uniref:Sugar transporter n=1 Tax=Fimbriimonas ginsengisoli Gsoil 348 TaxID=661478 RepID=A0A068NXJ2_FIMGI|nr:MFS transporter [Fimbriimonas ginsengisoli]AIE86354.1 sugar transporter [Fimbriimonas ginsengisoli Gsoil 348]
MSNVAGRRTVLDMNGYQWTVLLAAWLGWGFDVFDGLLFNYVAPNCVPTLLGITLGTPAAKSATLTWTGILTSLLLVGWGVGGIVFGRVCDRIGRTKTLLITMLLYAVGTALCAVAPNIWMLMLFRIVASLGIGGEWAAGAAMVAEVVPEKRRVEAGALLYTSGPVGLFLATYITFQIQGVFFKSDPHMAWRYVFLAGLIPAAVALVVRVFVKEPERWQALGEAARPRIAELFTPAYRRITLGGLAMAMVALISWWSVNAFIPVVATGLAANFAGHEHMAADAARQLGEEWKKFATNCFNLGGLLGTLITIPIAKFYGRKTMFRFYFFLAALSILGTFGLDLAPHDRLWGYFFIGLSVFGVFGSFTFYLPELFPTRLRGTGSGFCYNSGRFVAALGPFLVGSIAASGANADEMAIRVLFWVGVIPLLGLFLVPWITETKGQSLVDV